MPTPPPAPQAPPAPAPAKAAPPPAPAPAAAPVLVKVVLLKGERSWHPHQNKYLYNGVPVELVHDNWVKNQVRAGYAAIVK